MAVLHRAARGPPGPRDHLVESADPARAAARGVRGGDRCPGRRGDRGHVADAVAARRRHHLRDRPGAPATAHGDQHEPGVEGVGTAQRPAGGCHRGTAGHRPSRGSRARRRHDHRARVRPGHDRAAHVPQRRLHLRQPHPARRRDAVGCGAAALQLVGAVAPPGRLVLTHVLLRESGVWKDRNTEPVQRARRHADYAFNLAVNPEPAKELRLFGLQEWTISRFAKVRRHLFELEYQATRLREKSVLWAMLVVVVANLACSCGWRTKPPRPRCRSGRSSPSPSSRSACRRSRSAGSTGPWTTQPDP